ncbi:MAG: hypothetical protein QOG90_2296 [Actinomycetota bacterium]
MTDATTAPVGPRANFGQRFAAWLVDIVIIGVVEVVLSAILGRAAGQGLGGLLGLVYVIYLEGSPSGQTVGKRLLNIRIIDADNGGPIGYGRAVLRYFARILSALPCLLGFFWMLWDKNKQTWHDKITTDVVVPTDAYPVEAWPG